jgi:hypothetical protein
MLQDTATQAAHKLTQPNLIPHSAPAIAQPSHNDLQMQDSHRQQVRQFESDEQHALPVQSVSHIQAPSSDAPIAPRRLNPAHRPRELSQAEDVNEAVDVALVPTQGRRQAIQTVPPLIEQAIARPRQPEHTADAPDRSISEPATQRVIEAVHQRPAITPPVAPHNSKQVSEPLHESATRASLQPAITVTRLAPPVESPQPISPTIHVTIGRIEVRATPAPPAPRQRPAPAVMSLDDYLKRREGERP